MLMQCANQPRRPRPAAHSVHGQGLGGGRRSRRGKLGRNMWRDHFLRNRHLRALTGFLSFACRGCECLGGVLLLRRARCALVGTLAHQEPPLGEFAALKLHGRGSCIDQVIPGHTAPARQVDLHRGIHGGDLQELSRVQGIQMFTDQQQQSVATIQISTVKTGVAFQAVLEGGRGELLSVRHGGIRVAAVSSSRS